MKKKIIAVITAIAIVTASLALAITSLAATFLELKLDVLYIASIQGSGDEVWYTYTPSVSGTYSFVSYSTGRSEAYLYTRTVDENGIKSYTGLAFAPASDPNYMAEDVRNFSFAGNEYTHNATAFRLIYHLDAGTTYYFSAGWEGTTSTGEMRVRLKCDEYDNTVLQELSVTSNAKLTWYTDGEWRKDNSGVDYYYYNYGKILQNMTVTLTYKDGSTSSVTGANVIDGYPIGYTVDQSVVHWYNEEDLNYTQNIITVTVGNLSFDYNVVIEQGALLTVSGVVCDYANGDPISGARLSIGSSNVATTDSNGRFAFAYSPGSYELSVNAANAIPRKVRLIVNAQSSNANNHTDNPIPLAIGDYVQDGIINGKDFGYILHCMSGDERDAEQAKFRNQVNFTAEKYQTW